MTSKQFKSIIFFLGMAIFINFYYELNLFICNPESNNPEELPLINKLMGLATYTKDEFVQVMTSHFTQVTPYITFIAEIGKLFKLNDLLLVYFALHILALCLLYISIRHLLKLISNCNEFIVNLSIISLMLFLELVYVIPNQRNLFYDFLDPEFITYPFLLLAISFHINKKYIHAIICLFFGTILHPLYTIMLSFGLLFSLLVDLIKKRETAISVVKYGVGYLLSVFPYSFFLWFISRQTIKSNIDSSFVMEIIRAPHHYKIPTLYSCDKTTIIFFIYSLILGIISLFIIKFSLKKNSSTEFNKFKENWFRLFTINYSLVGLLAFVSLVTTFIRFPILIRLTPYRIGVIIVILTWVLFIASLTNLFDLKEHWLNIIDAISLCICVGIFLFVNLTRVEKISSITKPEKDNFLSWIKKNTSKDDLFLNYTDIDIRTTVLRSDFFRFQTPPLTGDSEIAWYKKYCVYYDIPDKINETDYTDVKKYASSKHTINTERVVKRSNSQIKYILISKTKKSFSRIEDWVNLKHKNYKYDLNNFRKIFENKDYAVYLVI